MYFQIRYFSCFCSKHTLWVLTSTHNPCFRGKKKKRKDTMFYLINHTDMSSWCNLGTFYNNCLRSGRKNKRILVLVCPCVRGDKPITLTTRYCSHTWTNQTISILMSNENATPLRCAKLRPIKSCAQICYVYLYSTIKGTFLHNNFNSNDSANIRRNVSLQITLIVFLAYTKNPRNFVQMFSVGQLIN